MYVDKANRYAYSFLAFVQEAIWYNTKLMKPEEVRTYDDLLQPKWTGKIGYSDPRAGGAGQGNWTFLWKTKGEDFLKKLVQQKLVIMREERPLAELLIKGSVAITIGLDIDNFGPFVKAGLPIKSLPQLREGIYPVTGSGTLAIIKNSPHPNAAKNLPQLVSQPGGSGDLLESARGTDLASGCPLSQRAVRGETGERIHDRRAIPSVREPHRRETRIDP
jgi:iron(III) transport system substrate-binding protein